MSLLRALACLPLAVAGAALLPRPDLATTPLSVPHRVLHGPGPSTAHPRVLATSSLPMLGHMRACPRAPARAHDTRETRPGGHAEAVRPVLRPHVQIPSSAGS